MPEYDKALMLYESLHQAILRGDVLSAHTVGRGGVAAAVTMMALGSRIGVNLTGVAEDALFLPAYGGIVAELKDGAPVPAGLREIGVTTEGATLSACGMNLSLSEARSAWSEPLETVFPTDAKAKHTTAPFIPYETRNTARPKTQIARPRVFIPSFPGTNCELDSEKAFRRAGAETDVFVFRNLTAKGIEESVEALTEGINRAQIVMLPGARRATSRRLRQVYRHARNRASWKDHEPAQQADGHAGHLTVPGAHQARPCAVWRNSHAQGG
ncbi:MAG: phosphoribosylformylglycinamidine synthase subunit PurQ [Christensenellales bacterium]